MGTPCEHATTIAINSTARHPVSTCIDCGASMADVATPKEEPAKAVKQLDSLDDCLGECLDDGLDYGRSGWRL